jgi:ankyrin repeat protein
MKSTPFCLACLCLLNVWFASARALADDVSAASVLPVADRTGAWMNADAEAVADALWFAAANGDLERYMRLTASTGTELKTLGAPTNALWIASQEGHTELVEFLLALGADVEAMDPADGRTALFQASQEGHAQIVKLLLDEGAQTETASRKTGATPLFIASARGHMDVVRLLLAAGARADATAVAGDKVDTPLSIARLRGHAVVAELLEERLH